MSAPNGFVRIAQDIANLSTAVGQWEANVKPSDWEKGENSAMKRRTSAELSEYWHVDSAWAEKRQKLRTEAYGAGGLVPRIEGVLSNSVLLEVQKDVLKRLRDSIERLIKPPPTPPAQYAPPMPISGHSGGSLR